MSFFGFGKKDRVIDLGEKYREENAEKREKAAAEKEKEDSGFSFLSGLASSSSSSKEDSDSGSEGEKKKKIAKRLLDITNKLDEMSTQIYHLQQRVELLERKTGVKSAG